MGQRHQHYDVRESTEDDVEEFMRKLRLQHLGDEKYWDITIFNKGKFVYFSKTLRHKRGHEFCHQCEIFIPYKEMKTVEIQADYRGRVYFEYLCKQCDGLLHRRRKTI